MLPILPNSELHKVTLRRAYFTPKKNVFICFYYHQVNPNEVIEIK